MTSSVSRSPSENRTSRERSGSGRYERERERSRSRRHHSRSRSRRDHSRSRRDHSGSRRDHSRSRRDHSGTRRHSSRSRRDRSSSRRDRSRSRRNDSRSRRKDSSRSDPHQSSSQTVPVPTAPPRNWESEDSSGSSEDEDKKDGEDKGHSREKRIKKVDPSNPFSTFEKQTRNKKQHFVPTTFIKEKWLNMRGLDEAGKFISEDDSKIDAWKHVAKSDRLIKKYAGEIFADTKLDDGLHSIVDRSDTNDEKDLIKQQRTFGSLAHLALKAMEGYAIIYKKLDSYVNAGIGAPKEVNPEWTGEEDDINPQYIYSEHQVKIYKQFQELQKELQVDVAEPIANVVRISASAFTNSLDKRREKVLSRIRRTNSKAATAINRIPPSATSLFGGDHSQLAKVVELTKDLSNTADRQGGYTPRTPRKKHRVGGGGGGNDRGGGHDSGYDKGHKYSQDNSGAGRGPARGGGKKPFRGGNGFRGKRN